MTRRGMSFVAAAVAAGAFLMASSAASAGLATYSQNFEGMDQASPTALSDDGWLVYGNVFGPDWSWWYGYGAYPAPNGTGGFSNVDASGQGGPAQGAQQIRVFNDYLNANHGDGSGAWIESNVFQEQVIDAGDVGLTWTFYFDVKPIDIAAPTTALAFIKTLDPNAGYAMTNFLTVDTTSLPTTWGSYSIPIPIDASLSGQILQFGFASTATNYSPSGIDYDNVRFLPEPGTLALLAVGGMGLARRRRR